MIPAISFLPLCPDCGREMFEIYGRFECLNTDCGNFDLKAPSNPADAVEVESVVDMLNQSNANGKEERL